jgi:hypothetical protein
MQFFFKTKQLIPRQHLFMEHDVQSNKVKKKNHIKEKTKKSIYIEI